LALIALVAVIAVRVLYLIPALALEHLGYRRSMSMRPRLTAMDERLGAAGTVRGGHRGISAESRRRFQSRIRRKVADIDYFMAVPLGWREGSVIAWAGMRGAVTLAAAQTLPQTTPDRSLIVFIAFLVAAG